MPTAIAAAGIASVAWDVVANQPDRRASTAAAGVVACLAAACLVALASPRMRRDLRAVAAKVAFATLPFAVVGLGAWAGDRGLLATAGILSWVTAGILLPAVLDA